MHKESGLQNRVEKRASRRMLLGRIPSAEESSKKWRMGVENQKGARMERPGIIEWQGVKGKEKKTDETS